MEKISDPASKEYQWQKEKEAIDKITDGLGLGIDEDIKDSVIVLHLLGINTSSSHKGKIDRYPIPYIDIDSSEAHKLENELASKTDELMSEEERLVRKEINALYDQLDLIEDLESSEAVEINKKIEVLDSKFQEFEVPENSEIIQLREKIEIENLKEREKINYLLQLFYKDRIVSDEARLIIKPKGLQRSRLQNQGSEIQEGESDENKKRERLQKFQAEMNAFTEFLKSSFFEK